MLSWWQIDQGFMKWFISFISGFDLSHDSIILYEDSFKINSINKSFLNIKWQIKIPEMALFLNNKWRYYCKGVAFIFFVINYPWECALLVFLVFKGVHLKRAISSEEQWTRELLKHEKFHFHLLNRIYILLTNYIINVTQIKLFRCKYLIHTRT